jgi:hypothetical protein
MKQMDRINSPTDPEQVIYSKRQQLLHAMKGLPKIGSLLPESQKTKDTNQKLEKDKQDRLKSLQQESESNSNLLTAAKSEADKTFGELAKLSARIETLQAINFKNIQQNSSNEGYIDFEEARVAMLRLKNTPADNIVHNINRFNIEFRTSVTSLETLSSLPNPRTLHNPNNLGSFYSLRLDYYNKIQAINTEIQSLTENRQKLSTAFDGQVAIINELESKFKDL